MASPIVPAGAGYLRHVKRGDGTQTGSVTVLDKSFYPAADLTRDFTGEHERRLNDYGTLGVKFPNAEGEDGTRHRDRFEILRLGKATPLGGGEVGYSGGDYRPGEHEWLELWREGEEEPEAVVTPISASLSRQSVELACVDALWLGNHALEGESMVWSHAPRDVFERYTRLPRVELAENFDSFPALTYSTSLQTSPDSEWKYLQADDITGGVEIRTIGNASPDIAYLRGNVFTAMGRTAADPNAPWRLDIRVRLLDRWSFDGAVLRVGLWDGTVNRLFIQVGRTYSSASSVITGGTVETPLSVLVTNDEHPELLNFSFEGHGRYVWCYLNGQLAKGGVVSLPNGASHAPMVEIENAHTGGLAFDAQVEDMMFRRSVPFLMRGADKGDYHLPGAAAPGGLYAEYWHNEDLVEGGQWHDATPSGATERWAAQTEKIIDLPPVSSAPSEWPPLQDKPHPSNNWAAILRGAVELDLASYDYRFRVTFYQRVRLWVGKTMFGQHLVEQWPTSDTAGTSPQTTGYLRAHLGNLNISGWYPIRIDFQASNEIIDAPELKLEWERSDAPGTWAVVPTAKLSPYGTYEAEPVHDSYYEQLKASVEPFGHQFVLAPKSLESGLFPGEVVPVARVGRDTDYELTDDQATDLTSTIDAQETCDSIITDAGGLQFRADSQPYSVEVFGDYDTLLDRMFLHQAYDGSGAEFTQENLLFARLLARLAVQGSPWEDVGARPPGVRELRDSWPLTGSLLKFDWEPGDAIKLNLEALEVFDGSPRQIAAITQKFVPAGFHPPTAGFRQRPRSFRAMLRTMLRASLKLQRRRITLTGTTSSGGSGGGGSSS